MPHTAITPTAAPSAPTCTGGARALFAATGHVLVETPHPRVWVLRLAGRLDPAVAARVLRLLDAHLELVAAGHAHTAHLVIDLDAVTSFERGGLAALRRHAPYTTAGYGITVSLSGCGGRVHLLPLRTRQLLAELGAFPTLEAALHTLTNTAPATPRPTEPDSTPDDPGPRSHAAHAAAPRADHRPEPALTSAGSTW